MKKSKRLFISFLALLTGTLLHSPVWASVSIVDPERTGSITIQSLQVEDTDKYTEPATGAPTDVSEFSPLANVSYTVTRVQDDAETPEDAKPLTDDNEYNKTERTNEDGQAVFGTLKQGVYLVQQQDSEAVQAKIDDFLVSVPTTNPAGTGWIYDVYVYPKYQLIGVPEIEIYVSEAGNKYDSLGLLETAHWLAVSDIPADIAGAVTYEVQLTLHEYLDYRAGGVSVFADAAGTQTPLTEDDYAVSIQEDRLTVTLAETGKTKLRDVYQGNPTAKLHTDVATILDIPAGPLPDALGSQIGVDVSLHYESSLGAPSTVSPSEVTPYVYTGGVNIVQYRGAGSDTMAGAQFQIYRTLSDAQSGTDPVLLPGSDTTWTVTTGTDGIAAFHGLSYGGLGIASDAGQSEYYLVQTQAPQGYNLMRAPQPVTVSAASHQAENQVTIRARTGFLLPATGGMGTVLFTVIGILLVGLAFYFYYRAKTRPRDHKQSNG